MSRKIKIVSVLSAVLIFLATGLEGCNQIKKNEQIGITRIDKMPDLPSQYNMQDWIQITVDYDKYVYDMTLRGTNEPVAWWDKARKNVDQDIVGLPAYIGDGRQTGTDRQESITVLAELLSATLAGVNKENQNGIDYIGMIRNFYNTDNGENLVLDGTDRNSGQSFWYEIYPHILFYQLSSLYPGKTELSDIVKATAEKWYQAAVVMSDNGKNPNFNYTAFDFDSMKPVDGKWEEPDSAAGIAWLMLSAYQLTGKEKYRNAAEWCMNFIKKCDYSPYYEVLLPFGVYTAARLNAEFGTQYDITKMLNWCFDLDLLGARSGNSVVTGSWGGVAVDGLMAFSSNGIPSAFSMNTFAMASPLVPLVRYDQRYAKAIGKWILNAANNARLFYPDQLPKKNQIGGDFTKSQSRLVAYESLCSDCGGVSPYGTGDATKNGWASTNLSVYGSSHVGIFGGMIRRTNVEKILALDCLKTDFYKGRAYPTSLYYNGYSQTKSVKIKLPTLEKYDLYDLCENRIIKNSVEGSTSMDIPAGSARVIVLLPARGRQSIKNGILYVSDVAVDYRINS